MILYSAVNTLRLGYKNQSASDIYREIIAVYYEIYTKHRNTLCGNSAEFLNGRRGGTLTF